MNKINFLMFLVFITISLIVCAENNNKLSVYSSSKDVKLEFVSPNMLFAIKSELVKEAYLVYFMPHIDFDENCNPMLPNELSVSVFLSWNLYFNVVHIIPNSNGDWDSNLVYKCVGNKEMSLPKNIYIKEQKNNINFWIHDRKNDIVDYILQMSDYYTYEPNTSRIIRLISYCVIPSTYNKDYIYWEDLWKKETWENCE